MESCPPPSSSTEDYMMTRAFAFTAALMALLGATLCLAGLYRLIRGWFTPFSAVGVLLRSTFVLFLPLLSYMLSHVQGEGEEAKVLFVLLWMLLMELIRKKVETMVSSAQGSFSRAACRFRLMDHSDEVTRLVWIGYLIYTSINGRSTDQQQERSVLVMAMFAILWSLALAKLGHRVLNKWMAQGSLTAASNAHLIAGYMQYIIDIEEEKRKTGDGGSGATGASTDPMANCPYVVMGEEKLVFTKEERRRTVRQRRDSKVLTITTPHCGYGVGNFPSDQDEQSHVHLLFDLNKVKSLVTVEKLWHKVEEDRRLWFFFSSKAKAFVEHLHLLCLSFSLFKLLRRRFEHYPMVEVGSEMARRLMFQGLLNNPDRKPEDNALRAFRVLQLELVFLQNYYLAGLPVVMSAPWLFVINFLLSLLFVMIYLGTVLVVVLKYGQFGTHDELVDIGKYLIITLLVTVTLLAIEFTEFVTTYLLSSWFLVHLLCLDTATGTSRWNWLTKPIIYCFIAFRFAVFYALRFILNSLLRRPAKVKNIKIKQVSILKVCESTHELFAWALPAVTLTTEAKMEIVDGFNGRGKTAAEIILACHLATELLEMEHGNPKNKKHKQQKQAGERDPQSVAATLSKYCMYLVARAPELLPDDEIWVSERYEEVKTCLKEASRRRCGGACCGGARRRLCLEAAKQMKEGELKDPAAWAGVELFQQVCERDPSAAWKELADFWVKLIIYLAPSNDVEGHAKVLASSDCDLITCLWAFCTHTGIRREPAPKQVEQHGRGADEPRGDLV
ncbi:hypothetical protein ACP70R_004152 [Stipagrostis hirtigluma subsp. patula]